jgi:hypothetical protein
MTIELLSTLFVILSLAAMIFISVLLMIDLVVAILDGITK